MAYNIKLNQRVADLYLPQQRQKERREQEVALHNLFMIDQSALAVCKRIEKIPEPALDFCSRSFRGDPLSQRHVEVF
uniref:Uncharacterized protein n=1 Tax=Hyaloperonospora arabidopsidis (strain Emoy2) TaxID=559515 RepID=M4BKH3_HYAAE